MLQARENLMEAIQAFLKKYDQIPPKERKEQATKVSSQYWKPPIFYDDDDDDDEESSIPLRDIISELPLSATITPDLPITDSLIMEDEHLNTIPETESDEENESSVKDLNLTPSKSEDLSEDLFDNESECDVPVCDDSSPNFTTFSNSLFDSNDDFTSNTLMVFSPKIDSLLEEFSVELAHIDSIPSGIDEADFDPEDDIRLVEKLLYDNSSPRPPKELNSEIPDAIIESFSPSPILVEDKLLNDDSISIPEYESFHVDFYNVPSSPRPPEKPPDDDVYFDIEPNTRVLTTKVVDDISDNSARELYVHMPNVLPILPTLYPVFDTLLPFSSENEDKVFNPGILIWLEKAQ
ncbi:hypothetical protein Tco_1019806 [Tanacetum coccineum]|uniref:Uncharacterized protein n=1 Tax=Tanacetum coccineum TaxID=301880 RepID=A0ABQ5FY67_9ASTR